MKSIHKYVHACVCVYIYSSKSDIYTNKNKNKIRVRNQKGYDLAEKQLLEKQGTELTKDCLRDLFGLRWVYRYH